ncbi:gliding motility-associated C-terminal domain-containing protein [Lewinella sp. 4G2]|uniref:gliding motility-associated C-terminal domain-containing protein n=1 Tax=Lewinella sp. 4G2 TaxID=1803372 RepID=UPI0007B4BD65|nr:gliding motility-associated C-terminal domain-containing protein [Lewinella sp. 4G2]OAV45385.1 hypothetical protein A3850_013175 [Lewinella sp. 4G2]
MRAIYFVLFLITSLQAFGQSDPSVTFQVPDVQATSGSTVCLPITAIDFSGGIEFSFALRHELDGGLTFNRVQNLNPDIGGFDMDDFNLTDFLFEGVITVSWRSYGDDVECVDAPFVVTLPDDAVLFEACYDAVGDFGSNHPVEIYDKPDSVPFDGMDDTVPVAFNKRRTCNSGLFAIPDRKNGSVTIGVAPLIFEINGQTGNFQPGDIFCLDIDVVSGFEDLTSYQFGFRWDETVLLPRDVTIVADLPQITVGTHRFDTDATFFGVWSQFTPTPSPESLAPGSTLLTVCYDVVGECTDRSDIVMEVLPRPTGSQTTNEANGATEAQNGIPIIDTRTDFAIDACNPNGFDVVIACPTENPSFGDTEVCIEVQAGTDFIDMDKMDYAISWNPNLLRFTGVGDRNSSLVINPADDFITDQTDMGTFFFDWDSRFPAGNSLDSGEMVFTLCFDAIGFGGTSPMTVSDFRNDIVSVTNGVFNGVDPRNCAITIERPGGVAVRFPDVGLRSSEDRCFPIEVDGFVGVTDFTLNVETLPALFDYADWMTSIPGIIAAEFSPGIVQLTYSGDALNLDDGTTIGEICYRARTTAEPGTCDSISLTRTVLPSAVVTEESAPQSVDITDFAGETCVLFPNGFGLNVADAEAFLDSTLCVPVSVYQFADIETAEIVFRFDPARVRFDELDLSETTWPGLNAANFDLSRVDIGIITLSFAASGPGVTTDGGTEETQVFAFCFETLNRDGCFELTAEPNATPPTRTSEGPGSIVINTGEVCIQDRIIITNVTAIPSTCGNGMDGQILYETAPRPDNEPIFIRTTNPVRIGRNGVVGGLPPGMQVFTLYTPGSDVQTVDSIFIPFDESSAAVANAGPDRFFSCNGTQATQLLSTNNEGDTYRLLFLNEDETRFIENGEVRADGSITLVVTEIGQYILEVTNEFGCTAQDTVAVGPGPAPVADAGPDVQIDCANDMITVTGGNSSVGPNVTYLWEHVTNQGNVIDTTSRRVGFTTDQPGRYRLTVTFADLQCTSRDSFNIFDEVAIPVSTLVDEVQLDCDGTAAELSVGEFNPDYLYSWTELEEGFPVSSNNTYFADRLGGYVVEIRDTTNSCSRLDTVFVVPSAGIPSIIPPEFLTAGCGDTPILIEPLYQNVDNSTVYEWSTMDGSIFPGDVNVANPRVLSPGSYRVVVANTSCTDTAFVLVGEALVPENVQAGPDVAVGCTTPVDLKGSAIGFGGGVLVFNWTRNGVDVPGGDTEQISVLQPGEYVFTATYDDTGCEASDTVQVLEPNGFPEYELADTVGGLGCAPSSVDLEVMVDDEESYTYVWADPNGQDISAVRTATATQAGFYTVTITDPETGCEATDQVFVDDDGAVRPAIALTQNGTVISCDRSTIVLDASETANNGNFTYAWEAIVDGTDVSDVTGPILEVTVAGTYRLTVTNEATGCSATQDALITADRDLPSVTTNESTALDCERRSTEVSINILDQPNDYIIRWTDAFGTNLPQDTTAIEVDRGGTYNATVTNLETSCVSIVSIRVADFQDSLATIVIAEPDSFDCNNPVITLDASGTVLAQDGSEQFTWASLDGNTIEPATGSLIVTVTGPGDYVFTVEDNAGCSVADTITVAAAANTPFADAGTDFEISCGDMPQLDGSASSPPPGGSVIYEWTAVAGGEIISGADGAMPFVSGIGAYVLVVTNTVNNCADSSIVIVSINEMERAVLPDDFTICGDTATVVANLPPGTTGVWTSFEDAGAVFSTEGNTASVTAIGDGISLVWTLSQDGCPNYSSDTIRIDPELTPEPADDELFLSGLNTTGTINLLDNDLISSMVTVELLTDPGFGEVTSFENGELSFRAPVGLTETTTIDYEVCSTVCPELCATATLTINSDAAGEDPQVYNAITPNGDGKNDVFVFELLERGASDFPTREFIVFNRWGDIVFEAEPYNNDWGGTGSSGDPLPEGTYYYILRLDIGEGDIIRGDVTIIR